MLANLWTWLRHQHPEVLGALIGITAMIALALVLAVWALSHFGRQLYEIDRNR
jgi:drug/metabolite transporter superfamily protein YnfA